MEQLASVRIKGMVEEKQNSPSLLNGMMVRTFLMDGDAEDELASVHTKGMVEEKQDSPAMLNRVMVKTFTKIDFGEKKIGLRKWLSR